MRRPRVFFEERDDPLISGIGWVSELIEIAGGIDVFTDRRQQGQRQEQPNGSAGESMPYRDIPVSGESSRSLRPNFRFLLMRECSNRPPRRLVSLRYFLGVNICVERHGRIFSLTR